jgi:sterol desaturase/sphingolipid hydroxylase (fatty acid hydroxylase superfamily)
MEVFSLAKIQIALAAVILMLIWLLESFMPVLPNPADNRISHSVRNILIGVFNAIVLTLLFLPLFAGLTTWLEKNEFGLLHLVELPVFVSAFLAIFLQDAWMYIWHRANHRIPFLWRFHKVHHSDPAMDASTAIRFHPGEIMISAILRMGVIALAGLSLWQVLLYDLFLLPVILVHHSNVRFPERLDRFYRLLLASPAMHRVHHSPKQIETDSNYGSIFSFWDRLARSFRLPEKNAPIKYGLNEYKGIPTESFSVLALMPFKQFRPSRK